MNRNKKILHKAAVNVLGFTIASAVAAGTVGEFAAPVSVWAAETQNQEARKTVYLNGSAKASEKADGSTEEKAVSSLGKALKCAGENGLILVSGTVIIDEKTELEIPSNVTMKRADGFEGKLIKITGKGTLTIWGKEIQAADIDTDSAEAGKEAFQIKFREDQKKPEEQQENTSEETSKTEKPDVSEEEQKPQKPDEPEKEPNEEEEHGGVEETPEEKNPEDSPQEQPETEQPDVSEEEQNPQQPDEPEKQPDVEKPSEPEAKPEEEKPETDVPEKEDTKEDISEQQPDIQQPDGTEKQEAVLTVPEKLVFQTKEEWKNFSFEEEKEFSGEGTFAWEDNTDLTEYETQMTLRFTPENLEKWDYTKISGWEEDSQTVVRKVQIVVEELKKTETEKPEIEEEQKPTQPQEEQGTDSKEEVTIIPVEPTVPEEEKQEQQNPSVENSAQPGKLGEVAQEAPEVIPVGSLIDESGVQVYADFLPFYVDLQVSYNDSVSQLPDAGIGEILSAYELKLWDLKNNTEYQIPEDKKVKVLIPLPENADCYSDLAIAHYLGNNEYEYFIFDKDGKIGNMTIEVKDGEEYLAFETASFSPFNVGGHQIVGPGITSPGHTPSTGTGNQSTQQSGQQQSQQSNNSSAQNNASQSSQGTSTTQKKPGNQTVSGSGSSNVTIIHTVKTGDDTEIAQYVLLGVGALALGAGAVVVKKKKKQDK